MSSRNIFFSLLAGLAVISAFLVYGHIRTDRYENLSHQMRELRGELADLTVHVFQDNQAQTPELLGQAKQLQANLADLSSTLQNDVKSARISSNADTQKLQTAIETNYAKIAKFVKDLETYQKLSSILGPFLNYNPATDLQYRSVREEKEDFMYRVSLAQFNIKEALAVLAQVPIPVSKSFDQELVKIVILAEDLLWATRNDKIEQSDFLHDQFLKTIPPAQSKIKDELLNLLQRVVVQLNQR